MVAKFMRRDSVLKRTEEGTGKMRARTSDISPKLRAVLFLIDGERTLGDLLDRAGSLSDLLYSQISALLEIGLIDTLDSIDPDRADDAPDATAPIARKHASKAQDLPPIVAAKMQLLLRLETTQSDEIDLLGAELLDAKTLRDLAFTAKSVTNRLAMSVGTERSQKFWADAKEILTAWRDLAARDAE
ncbi:MAG: hypothetical protein LH481_07365 [Burkholderiales bacterium]|nr:hypothetical protein [Burkholderiales bacterium]